MLTEILIAGSQTRPRASASRDHLLGQPPDQADLLGDGNEHVGADDSGQRMIPAREHLEADDLAGGEVHLRLEIGKELAVLEAEADALLDLALGDQRALHAGVEPDRPRDAAAAGMVQRDVGAAQEIGDAGFGAGGRAMPAKAPTWMIRSSNVNGRVTARSTASAICSACRLHRPAASSSAIANSSPLRRRDRRPRGRALRPEAPAIALQQPVADLIAVLVVDRLEPLDLERDDDQLLAPAPAAPAQARRRGRRSPCGCRGR